MLPHQPMFFNYRKIDSPSTGTIGLYHLPHEEKQTLPVKLQNVFNSFKLSRYSLLAYCVQSHSKLF